MLSSTFTYLSEQKFQSKQLRTPTSDSNQSLTWGIEPKPTAEEKDIYPNAITVISCSKGIQEYLKSEYK